MAKETISRPLAPAPESKDHITLKSPYELFIGGKRSAPKSGNYFDTINPANETGGALCGTSTTWNC